MSENSPPRRFAVVLNEESGTIVRLGRETVTQTLTEAFANGGATAALHWTTGRHLSQALETAAQSEVDAVVVGGGDGTVAAAANLLVDRGLPMGILPLGTFNLAARDIGMPLDLAAAAQALAGAPVRAIDIMEVEGRLALCLIVMGFYPALKMASPEHHGWWMVRAWRNITDAFRRAATFPALDLSFLHAGQTTRTRTRMVLIANNDYADVFGMLPQRTSLDAGFFTLYVSRHRTRRGMMRSALAWLLGRWRQDSQLIRQPATELEIRATRHRTLPVMVDGEVERLTLPLNIKMRPRALKVLVPETESEAKVKSSP